MSKYTNEFYARIKEDKKMNREEALKKYKEMFSKTGFTLIEMKVILNRINN